MTELSLSSAADLLFMLLVCHAAGLSVGPVRLLHPGAAHTQRKPRRFEGKAALPMMIDFHAV
jgi:hypothetical protein